MNGDGTLRTTFLGLNHQPARLRNHRQKQSQCCQKANTSITGCLKIPEQSIEIDRSRYTKDRIPCSQTHSDLPCEVQGKQQNLLFQKAAHFTLAASVRDLRRRRNVIYIRATPHFAGFHHR